MQRICDHLFFFDEIDVRTSGCVLRPAPNDPEKTLLTIIYHGTQDPAADTPLTRQFEAHHIAAIVPTINNQLAMFLSDDFRIKYLQGVQSRTMKEIVDIFSDKEGWTEFLCESGANMYLKTFENDIYCAVGFDVIAAPPRILYEYLLANSVSRRNFFFVF